MTEVESRKKRVEEMFALLNHRPTRDERIGQAIGRALVSGGSHIAGSVLIGTQFGWRVGWGVFLLALFLKAKTH